MSRGRKPGYKHSEITREKIRKSHLGKTQKNSTKEKISNSMQGLPKSPKHRDAIADSLYDVEHKCMLRFLELRSEYPDHQDFFDKNQSELLFAMRSVKSEKELRDIKRYIETTRLDEALQQYTSYQYESSSFYAQEDAMISLLDAISFLRKVFSTKDENLLKH